MDNIEKSLTTGIVLTFFGSIPAGLVWGATAYAGVFVLMLMLIAVFLIRLVWKS